jgi:hypothetical protein
VGPRAGLDTVETRKILLLPEIEPRPSIPQPVAISTELSRLIKKETERGTNEHGQEKLNEYRNKRMKNECL